MLQRLKAVIKVKVFMVRMTEALQVGTCTVTQEGCSQHKEAGCFLVACPVAQTDYINAFRKSILKQMFGLSENETKLFFRQCYIKINNLQLKLHTI